MKTKNSLPIAIVITGIIIGGAIIFSQGDSQPRETEQVQEDLTQEIQLQPTQPQPIESQSQANIDDIEIEGWPSLGNIDAPVTIVEYSDFACPFCGRFFEETLPLIKENYIDTGQVRYVYKDFPVVGGDRAAEAAHCADEQGSFWEYHDLLFENLNQDRGRWSDSQVHQGYAQILGIDANALVECFEERRYQEKVIRSAQEAASLGIQGTPGFIINNEIVFGAQPFQVFEEIIKKELN